MSQKIPPHILSAMQHGAISFQAFMQLALYAPTHGYYRSNQVKFGKDGDFITAPELSVMFAQCLALQCRQILTQTQASSLMEIGAGSGRLALNLLQALESENALPEHYYILEISGYLRAQQQQLLQEQAPQLLSKVTWLEQLPEKFTGVIIANEVLDAMPVHRFCIDKGEIFEYFVGEDENELSWLKKPIDNSELSNAIKSHCAHLLNYPLSYNSEINLLLPGFINSLSDILQTGAILILDYGYTRTQYYLPERHMGTLICHHQHLANENPLQKIGEQDITAFVDFTHVAESAAQANLDVMGYTTQANFLINLHLLDFLTSACQNLDQFQQVQLNQQIKKLIMPQEMGEVFKVMALGRNLQFPLQGFQQNDLRSRL